MTEPVLPLASASAFNARAAIFKDLTHLNKTA
jgi:hypothetical protein